MLGEIFSRKKVRNFVKIKNPEMIQLSRMQLTSQSPSHLEITKMLSISQAESRIVECQCQKLISAEETGY